MLIFRHAWHRYYVEAAKPFLEVISFVLPGPASEEDFLRKGLNAPGLKPWLENVKWI